MSKLDIAVSEKDFQSETVTMELTRYERKEFINQYNNVKYLMHPEKTYTQTLLNRIFDPKPVSSSKEKKSKMSATQQKSTLSKKITIL